jgi:hypothetical protein
VTRAWSCTCDPTRGDSCRVCDGTARDERDPNYFQERPGDAEAGDPRTHGRSPLWAFIYPHLADQGDVA